MFRVAALAFAPAPVRVERMRLHTGLPPGKIPPAQTFGSYCIRAEVAIEEEGRAEAKGCVRGYGVSMHIAQTTKDLCDRLVLHTGDTCTEPSVVILTNMNTTFVCDGVFFELGEDRRRLL